MIWENCTENDETYDALKRAISARQGDEHFPMVLTYDAYHVFAKAWNMGIDAHLEALTDRSSVEERDGKAHVSIHPEELPTLVRRLFELGESEDHTDESGPAQGLAESILYALDLED